MKTMHENYPAFIRAFADATGLNAIEADAQWAAFSDMLTDSEREAVEARGADAGRSVGVEFNEFVGPEGAR